MKRRLLVALAALLLGAIVAGLIVWGAYTRSSDAAALRLAVEPGTTLHDVAARLHARGALTHRRVFLLAARIGGRDRALPVGTFQIPAGASPRDILRILLEEPPEPVVVTLPEGMVARAMAEVVADSLGLAAETILAAADARVAAAADQLMAPSRHQTLQDLVTAASRPDGRTLHWCEGYLAPDTYHFAPGSEADQVAAIMVELQLERLRAVQGRGDLDPHELLTLASLVEAEARQDDERTRIAAVYRNRLARGMRLEADPTIAFWLGKRGERLLYRDLEVDSPYNTYRRAGLPPGPVLAPGEAAIQAAAAPDSSCRALYFVADGDGGHVFSETLDEHNRAVARYRELMRGRRR